MGRERYSAEEQDFYRRYLNSQEWRTRKNARIVKAEHRCEFVATHYRPGGIVEERCCRVRYLCVHHNTYERLGQEKDSDLDVYCWFHHILEHLLWKRCKLCGEPCLGYDTRAELWLTATLAQMEIDLDAGPVVWQGLPTKETLAEQIDDLCFRCGGT
jgi:hypothetical protein